MDEGKVDFEEESRLEGGGRSFGGIEIWVSKEERVRFVNRRGKERVGRPVNSFKRTHVHAFKNQVDT